MRFRQIFQVGIAASIAFLGIFETPDFGQSTLSSKVPAKPTSLARKGANEKAPQAGDTAIFFPTYVGRLSRMPRGWNIINRRTEEILIGPAKGRVMVPKDADLSLKLDYVFTEHPELLVVPACNLVHITGDGIGFEDGICTAISKIPSVKRLDLTSSEVTDAGVVKLCAMKQLRVISLDRTMIDGTCLHALAKLPLTYLDIGQNKIKPSTYKDLALFTHVGRARFIGANLSDDALKYICKMDSLFDLELRSNSKITSAGLKNLLPLKHPVYINLRDTKIGLDGVEWLLTHLKLTGLVVDEKMLDNHQGLALKAKYAKILNPYAARDLNEVNAIYAPLK